MKMMVKMKILVQWPLLRTRGRRWDVVSFMMEESASMVTSVDSIMLVLLEMVILLLLDMLLTMLLVLTLWPTL